MSYTLINLRPPGSPLAPQQAALQPAGARDPLVDSFGRRIAYLRMSVTDRCDLRCTYCMPERMTFLPKGDILSFEELEAVASAFAAHGVDKLRITGGEPLVRRDIMDLFRSLSRHLDSGRLRELTLTTNGTQLRKYAIQLAAVGVKRINVSLDTLDREVFARLARRDVIDQVLAGIDAAQEAGLAVKINTVALRGVNEQEIEALVEWAHARGCDITLIETMPMGEAETDREGDYLPLDLVRSRLAARWTLTDLDHRSGGPARYVRVAETGGRLGFITPLTHNFCESCNRVRITATGRLYTCLGREEGADLRTALRSDPTGRALEAAIATAIAAKPKGHDFDAARLSTPASPRTMSTTGG